MTHNARTHETPEWSLTILPVTAFGLRFEQLRLSERQMQMDPNVYSVHHFDGSWKPIRIDRCLALARARERTQLAAIQNSMKTNVARAMRNNVAEPHGWTMR